MSISPAASPSLVPGQLRALGFGHSSFLGIRRSWHQALPGCGSVLTSKSLPLWTCLHKCRIWWQQYYRNQSGYFCCVWQEANSRKFKQKGRCWVLLLHVIGEHRFRTSRDSHSIIRILSLSPSTLHPPLTLTSALILYWPDGSGLPLSLLSSPFEKEGFSTSISISRALTKLRFPRPIPGLITENR